jgi:hypothetical protein
MKNISLECKYKIFKSKTIDHCLPCSILVYFCNVCCFVFFVHVLIKDWAVAFGFVNSNGFDSTSLIGLLVFLTCWAHPSKFDYVFSWSMWCWCSWTLCFSIVPGLSRSVGLRMSGLVLLFYATVRIVA